MISDRLVLWTLDPSLFHINNECLDLAALRENIHWNIGILVGRCSSRTLLHLQMPLLQCIGYFRYLWPGLDGHQQRESAISPGVLSHLLYTMKPVSTTDEIIWIRPLLNVSVIDWSGGSITDVKHRYVTQLGCANCWLVADILDSALGRTRRKAKSWKTSSHSALESINPFRGH